MVSMSSGFIESNQTKLSLIALSNRVLMADFVYIHCYGFDYDRWTHRLYMFSQTNKMLIWIIEGRERWIYTMDNVNAINNDMILFLMIFGPNYWNIQDSIVDAYLITRRLRTKMLRFYSNKDTTKSEYFTTNNDVYSLCFIILIVVFFVF